MPFEEPRYRHEVSGPFCEYGNEEEAGHSKPRGPESLRPFAFGSSAIPLMVLFGPSLPRDTYDVEP